MIKKFCYRFRHLLICLLLLTSFFSARGFAAYAHSKASSSIITIAVDAGHGGADPGKVGNDNILEKDVNLSIAIKLGKLLENKGFNVIYTRTSDCDLAADHSNHRKSEDLKNRIKFIDENKADLTISIHQNSFPDESVCGPQAFFYSNSNESEILAQIIQSKIDSTLDISNSRGIKSNSDYYLLKKSPTPTVIVECGFLSNPAEAANLTNEAYQNKLSRAIYLGICDYIKKYY